MVRLLAIPPRGRNSRGACRAFRPAGRAYRPKPHNLSTRATADTLNCRGIRTTNGKQDTRCRSIVSAPILACDWSTTGGLVFAGVNFFRRPGGGAVAGTPNDL